MASGKQQGEGFVGRLKRPFLSMSKFLRDVWNELQRVVWPSNEECWGFTVVTIVGVLVVAIWVGLWDFFFSRVLALLGV